MKVDNGFKLGETNKSAGFLKKFPNGKVMIHVYSFLMFPLIDSGEVVQLSVGRGE